MEPTNSNASPHATIDACPHLPAIEDRLDWQSMAPHREVKNAAYYLATLRYSQSLWLEGKPAQAILQLNKAWAADLPTDDPVLTTCPSPFRALCWMLDRGPTHGFFGNPVRHFQHLATRMSGPRKTPRTWRAWACFCLAENRLDPTEFPRDQEQITAESIRVPSADEVEDQLAIHGWTGEAECFAELMA